MPILGVDTGGTFTDFYLISDTGEITVYKRPSTPDDPARAILEGLAESPIANLQLPISDLVHGSTVATNAIIERTGARTGLITTRGFRDVLVIGRQTRPGLYDLSPPPPPPGAGRPASVWPPAATSCSRWTRRKSNRCSTACRRRASSRWPSAFSSP